MKVRDPRFVVRRGAIPAGRQGYPLSRYQLADGSASVCNPTTGAIRWRGYEERTPLESEQRIKMTYLEMQRR